MQHTWIRGLICWLCAATTATAATPLLPHQIKDMILLGQEGASQSILTRRVSLAGNYVYASGQTGLQTVNVSNPSNLVLTSDYTDTSLQPNGSIVVGNVLLLANWTPAVGLLLLNLSNSAQPTHLRTIPTSLHTWEVEVYGNYLYLTIGAELDSGVNTYDITDPSNPVLINAFTIGDRLLGKVARFGNYIYFGHKNQLRVYNVTNASNPQFVRTITLNSTLGNAYIYNNRLWLLGRAVIGSEQGGMWVYSLNDASNPQQIGYWSQPEPRDICFLSNFAIVPCSGSGIYTLNISNPINIAVVSNWGVSWPNTGPHGGYPINICGAGRYVYVGTTSGNDPSCDDFTCPNYGARLYSAQALLLPPVIDEVSPDPEPFQAGSPYVRQMTLSEGPAPISWTLLDGPPGAQVSAGGIVSGWTPSLADVGQGDVRFEVRASNVDGEDTEAWRVHVTVPVDGDFDNDGDSDQSDFAHLQRCFSGDANSYLPGCGDADFDADNDIDPADLASLLSCMRGADVPPGC